MKLIAGSCLINNLHLFLLLEVFDARICRPSEILTNFLLYLYETCNRLLFQRLSLKKSS